MNNIQEKLLKPLKAIYGTPRWFDDKEALRINLEAWNKAFSHYTDEEISEGLTKFTLNHGKRGFPLPAEVRQHMPKRYAPVENKPSISRAIDSREEKAQEKAVGICAEYGEDRIKDIAFDVYRVWHNEKCAEKIKDISENAGVRRVFSGVTWMRMCIMRGLEDEVLSRVYSA